MKKEVSMCLLAYVKYMELFCQVNLTASLSYKPTLQACGNSRTQTGLFVAEVTPARLYL